MTMEPKAVQEYYPNEWNYCYGCGQRNDRGLHLRTYLDGDETVATFIPRPYDIAIPGYVYGGLIASLIDSVVQMSNEGMAAHPLFSCLPDPNNHRPHPRTCSLTTVQ